MSMFILRKIVDVSIVDRPTIGIPFPPKPMSNIKSSAVYSRFPTSYNTAQ